MKVTINTSGSTDAPKQVCHTNIEYHAQRAITEIGLNSSDIVLDVFPANVIAHYTITALPALLSGAHLFSTNFNPYSYIKLFNEIRPTVISLIPKHHELLTKTKNWNKLDMSCVRYMVTGSNKISQNMIDDFKKHGVKLVANWYGMTEMPPPVFIGYNTESFDFTPTLGYDVTFSNNGECIINNYYTGDIFDLETKKFITRKKIQNGNTWKT